MIEGESAEAVMDTVVFAEGVTKEDIRQKMWDHIEKHNLADNPRPVYNRIPNFKDRNAAAEHLKKLEGFEKAKTVKINPDKPQEWARFLTLDAEKDLLVPTPRLRGGLFNRILPESRDKESLKVCATTQGIRKFSKPVGLDAKVKVDMIVSGSVAVSTRGYRIGKGEGFADLEYAMMRTMNATDADTLVVTSVHDCQVVDIPESLMEDHDFMVDYILTPTQVIQCTKNRPQPSGIIWSKLTAKKLRQIPILRELREREKAEGKDVELKAEIESDEDDEKVSDRNRHQRRPRRYRSDRNRGSRNKEKTPLSVKYDFKKEMREVSVVNGEMNVDGESSERKPGSRQYSGRRKYRKTVRRQTHDNGGSDGEDIGNRSSDKENSASDYERNKSDRREGRDYSDSRRSRRPGSGYRSRPFQKPRGPYAGDSSFKPTVYIGNFPESLRVRTLKTAVRGKGIQPLAVLWKYHYAFLLMPDLESAKDAVRVLSDLEFEGQAAKVALSRLCQEREGVEQNGDVEDSRDNVKKENSCIDTDEQGALAEKIKGSLKIDEEHVKREEEHGAIAAKCEA